jgi:hypothetical protein
MNYKYYWHKDGYFRTNKVPSFEIEDASTINKIDENNIIVAFVNVKTKQETPIDGYPINMTIKFINEGWWVECEL